MVLATKTAQSTGEAINQYIYENYTGLEGSCRNLSYEISKLFNLHFTHIMVLWRLQKMKHPLYKKFHPHFNRYEIDTIIKYYDGTVKSVKRIHELLPERSVTSIYSKLSRMKLTTPVNKPTVWTKEAAEKAYELCCQYGVDETARMLNKTKKALLHGLHRNKLSAKMYTGYYRIGDVCYILNRGYKYIMYLINNGTLKASREGKSGFWKIKRADLRTFMIKYPEELSDRKLDFVQILEVLGINMLGHMEIHYKEDQNGNQ